VCGTTPGVVRGGEILTVAAAEPLPGDVVLLEAGNVVLADLRLIEVAQLKMDEALLTGESVTADKTCGALSLLAQVVAISAGSAHWRTMAFTVLTLAQLTHVLALSSAVFLAVEAEKWLVRQGWLYAERKIERRLPPVASDVE
jgi:P-type E1-E2 ATPase